MNLPVPVNFKIDHKCKIQNIKQGCLVQPCYDILSVLVVELQINFQCGIEFQLLTIMFTFMRITIIKQKGNNLKSL